MRCDPDTGSCVIKARPGMTIRLTRNLHKDRGFVNDAMGQVCTILRADQFSQVFTVRFSHGVMVLAHPMCEHGVTCLPAVYGYAMTTRKAQGASLKVLFSSLA
eukprot:7145840-Karenia_brevis.AAC.1